MSKFIMTDELKAKWQPVIEAEGAPKLKSATQRNQMINMLENTVNEAGNTNDTAIQDPDNSGTGYPSNGQVNPTLISLVRRAVPALIANDIVGMQPMSGPTGLIFAIRSYRGTDKATRTETFVPGTDNARLNSMTTSAGENLGTDEHVAGGVGDPANDPVVQTNPWQEVSFGIEKTSVEARTRAMKATYTDELAQDLRAQHGLDASSELAKLLSVEVVNEMNRELIALIDTKATDETEVGAAGTPLAVAGDYDVDLADGRWAAEKARMLANYIVRQANKIAVSTGRGRGNFAIVSSSVAQALELGGSLNATNNNGVALDNTSGVGVTLAGTLSNGLIKVYVDQFMTTDKVIVGFRGASVYDAGIFYCPYVPLQMMQSRGEDDFQPRMGFKTRYGLADHPFGAGNYYRKFDVLNLSAIF